MIETIDREGGGIGRSRIQGSRAGGASIALSLGLALSLFVWAWLTVQPQVGQQEPFGKASFVVPYFGWRVLPWLALFWAGVFAYGWIWSVRERGGGLPLLRLFRMGFLLHAGLLLPEFTVSQALGLNPLESAGHRLYVYFFVSLAAGGISAWALADPIGRDGVRALETALLAVAPYSLFIFLRQGDGKWGAIEVMFFGICFFALRHLGRRRERQAPRLSPLLFQIVWAVIFVVLASFFFYRYTLGLSWFNVTWYYVEWAQDLLRGRPIPTGEAYGYWMSLAAFIKVFGANIPLLLVFQYLLAGVAAWTSAWMAGRMGGEEVGRWTAVLFLVNYTLVFVALFVHWAVLVFVYHTFQVAAALKAYDATGGRRVFWLCLSGALLGVLISVRIENVVLLPLMMGWLFWGRTVPLKSSKGREKGLRILWRWKEAGAYLLPLVLLMIPFSYLNYRSMGTAYPVTTQKGQLTNEYTIAHRWVLTYRETFPTGLNPIEQPGAAWEAFKKEPVRIIGRFFTKGGGETPYPANNLWKRFVMGPAILFSTHRWRHMHLLFLDYHSRWFFYLCFYSFAFFLLGLILVLRCKPRHPFWSLFLGLIATRYMLHVLLEIHHEGAERYSIPFYPFILPFIAVAIGSLVRLRRPAGLPPVR
ncbi:MAG: hypothetical protein ACE5JS_17720 [Nitrospinota bacterium]